MIIEILNGKLTINGFVFKSYKNETEACRARDTLVDLLENQDNTYSFAETNYSDKHSGNTIYTCTLSISCKKSSSPQPQPATG